MRVGRLSYNINWKNFKPGYSFFVPCLNCMQAKQDIGRVAKRLKMPVLMQVSIEEGIRGVRVWRV
jgi:hypothetical protein